MTTEARFSSACDPRGTLDWRQFTLRQFLALSAVCGLVALGFAWSRSSSESFELLTAAKNGDLDQLEWLVDFGVDIHARDGWNTTALMLAASHGHSECVWCLLVNGAHPNERSRLNRTPLMWAAASGKKEIVELLIEHGATASLTEENGLSAAEHARRNRYNELADFIERN